MEITSNKFARETFSELGIQKISGIFDYENPSLQRYKSDLAEKVKELLDMEDISKGKITNQQPAANNISNTLNNNKGIFN